MEWSIQQLARLAGTTSRTLRHYGELGLVTPSRIGGNGYRYYDEHALVRLQRVLLLRELGLGLAEMYVADERFAANYGGMQGAAFVRDALTAHIDGLDAAASETAESTE